MNTEAIGVRDIGPTDLGRVVELHFSAFPGFLMSQLGPGFLRTYYATVLDYPGRIFLGSMDTSGALMGFVAGFVDPAGFYRSLQTRKLQMLFRGILHVMVRPPTWLRVLDNVREMDARGERDSGKVDLAELASVGVHPSMGGRGHGRHLVTAFTEHARRHAVREVCLTTDSANNDSVNRFYIGLGFTQTGSMRRAGGRLMNAYVMRLDDAAARREAALLGAH